MLESVKEESRKIAEQEDKMFKSIIWEAIDDGVMKYDDIFPFKKQKRYVNCPNSVYTDVYIGEDCVSNCYDRPDYTIYDIVEEKPIFSIYYKPPYYENGEMIIGFEVIKHWKGEYKKDRWWDEKCR